MPKLSCDVSQCIHNTKGLCAKNYIDVDGPKANNKNETCCKSYLLDNPNSFNYEFAKEDSKNPTVQTEVYCDAIKCVYEKGQRCYADRIKIANTFKNEKTQMSKEPSVTHCQTFEPRD